MAYKKRYFAGVPVVTPAAEAAAVPPAAPAEPGEKAYLEELQRFRILLNTKTFVEAVNIMCEETGNDDWEENDMGEGSEDWRSDFFRKTIGASIIPDYTNDTQKWAWKLWVDECIKWYSATLYPQTFYPSQKDLFVKGGDAWEALNAGWQVTLDKTGNIIDVWDPVTKKTYDVLGNEITDRETSYRTSPVKPQVEPYKAPPEEKVPKDTPHDIPAKPTLPQPMYEWDDLQGRDTINALIQYQKDMDKRLTSILFDIGWALEGIRVCLGEMEAAKVLGTQTENFQGNYDALGITTNKLEEEGICHD